MNNPPVTVTLPEIVLNALESFVRHQAVAMDLPLEAGIAANEQALRACEQSAFTLATLLGSEIPELAQGTLGEALAMVRAQCDARMAKLGML